MGFQLLTLYCIVEPFLSPKYVHLTSVAIYHQKIKEEDCICPKFHQFLFAVILISYLNSMFLLAIIFLHIDLSITCLAALDFGNFKPGLHNLWYPGIRDTSTWSKFGAHGEHGDVFLFSNLGAL